MENKDTFIELKCKSCGGTMEYKSGAVDIECFYCGKNYLISDFKDTPEPQTSSVTEINVQSSVRIEGISSAASAVAYIDEYIEDYDWDSYVTARDFEISELNRVVAKMKSSYADDKNTWISAYNVLYVTYKKKVEGCYSLIREIIAEYSADNDDIYTKFDSYKLVAAAVKKKYEKTVEQLDRYTAKAGKYGAEEAELASLKERTAELKVVESLKEYESINEIPAVAKAMESENRRIAAELAAQGINADMAYERAIALEKSGKHAVALNLLYNLKGYKDSAAIASRINKYFSIDDVLEIAGKLYFYKREEDSYGTTIFSLYPLKDGMIDSEALIKDIIKVVENFADKLYYINTEGHLRCYDFSAAADTEISDESFDASKVFYPKKPGKIYLYDEAEVYELDLFSGSIKVHCDMDFEVKYWDKENLVIQKFEEVNDKQSVCIVRELDIATLEYTDLYVGTEPSKMDIEAFYKGNVIYTVCNPDESNRELYIKKLRDTSKARLLEANILRFIRMGNDRVFYSIGSDRRSTLITLDLNDNTRCQMVSYIDNVLYQKGDWVYFTRKSGSNSVLCRCRVDGSKYTFIADKIKKTVEFKNGYLYYINTKNSLICVRMDGTNSKHLCNNVEFEPVLRDDKLVFTSSDYMDGENKKYSIYAVDHERGGLIKLAYDIKHVKAFDKDMMYFINSRECPQTPGEATTYDSNGNEVKRYIETLYRIDLNTNTTEQLMILETIEAEKKSYLALLIAICLVVMFVLGCIAESWGLILISLIGVLVGAAVLYYKRTNK